MVDAISFFVAMVLVCVSPAIVYTLVPQTYSEELHDRADERHRLESWYSTYGHMPAEQYMATLHYRMNCYMGPAS